MITRVKIKPENQTPSTEPRPSLYRGNSVPGPGLGPAPGIVSLAASFTYNARRKAGGFGLLWWCCRCTFINVISGTDRCTQNRGSHLALVSKAVVIRLVHVTNVRARQSSILCPAPATVCLLFHHFTAMVRSSLVFRRGLNAAMIFVQSFGSFFDHFSLEENRAGVFACC